MAIEVQIAGQLARAGRAASPTDAFLSGGGEMGALMRAHDWASTALGAPHSWSGSLRMMVSFLLANRFPLLLWWGPQYISLYNDAYRPVLGGKHPQALGLPCSECWSETWQVLKPLIDTPFSGGPATWMEDLELEVLRHGYPEETHFTAAYSPVPDETAPRGIGGVLATVHEITETVVSRRRVALLSELGTRLAGARTAELVCHTAAEVLAAHSRDVPFVMLYLIDAGRTHLVRSAAVGIAARGTGPASIAIESAGASAPWPLALTARTEEPQVLGTLPPLQGSWSRAPQQALVVPIRSNVAQRPAGVAVFGVSPGIALDAQYRTFFDLLTVQISSALASAREYEAERRRAESLAETDRARTRERETWLTGEKQAFQAAIDGAPLEVSLGMLIRTAIGQLGPDVRCAFYTADEARRELRHVVGMSESYARCVDGFRIGADSLACGLAVHTGQPVITPDVRAEPRWREWLWLAEQEGFRGCWSFPVETEKGRIVGTFAMYHSKPRDATAKDRELAALLTQAAALIISRHQQAEARAGAYAALSAADRQKDEFLAMLAHELRNPLAPLRTTNELLSKLLGTSNPTVAGALDIARRQVDQLTRLVDDLLDVSRVTQGRIELQRRPTSVPQIVAQALEAVQPLMREKRHRVTVQTLGMAAPFVNADPARLTQCLVNVLTNATKYTGEGGRIELRILSEKGHAVIEVVDSGVGIAPELLPRIFDLFVQGERTLDRTQGGLGVGLAVVKRLVEMHEGEVRVHSAGPGRGASFEMRIPLAEQPLDRAVENKSPAIAAARVLVVDDNEDSADSLATLLKLEGHEVQAVYSATDALEHAQAFRPEVLLIDVGLPQMDGYELARRLRALPALRGSTLIAVTGYGMPEDRARATAAGFDEHLVKPVGLASLVRAMAAADSRAAGSRDRVRGSA